MAYEAPPWNDDDLPAFNGEDEFFQITDQIADRVALYGPLDAEQADTNGHAPQPLTDEPVAPEGHSWQPINLLEKAAEPPEPPTISGIIYPGRRHIFSGEPGAFKSWAVLCVMVEEMRKGRAVMYVDHEMGFREMTERLQQLGVTNEELNTLFLYIEPAEKFTDDRPLNDTVALVTERNPSLIVIDAFTGCLALHGLDPDSGVQIEEFYQTIVNPLRSAGAAVVLLDHLPKNREGRGQYSINSERKVGATDVHLSFAIIQPFGRGKTGRVGIHTKRDRPGYLPRPLWGELRLESHPETSDVIWEWKEPEEETEQNAPLRPTKLMEKVSMFMESYGGTASRKQIEDGVQGNAKFKRIAIDTLVHEAYLSEESGPNRSRVNSFIRPFREATDPGSSVFVPVRPDQPAEFVPPSTPPSTRGVAETNQKRQPSDDAKTIGSSDTPAALDFYDTLFVKTGDEEFDDGVDF